MKWFRNIPWNKRPWLPVMAVIGLLYALSWPGHLQSGDNACSIATAQAIVNGEGLLIDPAHQPTYGVLPEVTVSGKVYSRFGIGLPILYLPVALVEKLLVRWLPAEWLHHALFSLVPALFALLAFGVLARLMEHLALPDQVVRRVLVICFGFTMVYKYSVTDHYEIIQAAFLLLAFFLAVASRPVGAGCCLAALVALKAANLVLLPGFVVYGYGRKDGPERALRDWASLLAPVALMLAGLLALNWHRYGSLWEFGYGRIQSEFSPTHLAAHLVPLVFSLEMGFFTFSPPLLLLFPGIKPFYRARPRECLLAGYVILALYGLSAAFNEPKGGVNWGPRYLVPCIPLAALMIGYTDFKRLGVKIAASVLLVMAAGVNGVAILEKSLEYDVIRYTETSREPGKYLPQIAGCARILHYKVSHSTNVYPRAIFEKNGRGWVDMTQYQTFKGVNLWYWHLAERLRAPGLKALLAAYGGTLLLVMSLALRLVWKDAPGRCWPC